MLGTFRAGDQLLIQTGGLDRIKPGDIILFYKNNTEIVHRVIAVEAASLVTRGDNNKFPDPDPVLLSDVVGIVTGFERRQKVHSIQAGAPGLFKLRLVHFWFNCLKLITLLGRFPYRWLRDRRLIAYFWHPDITTMQFQTEHGIMVKYMHKMHTVARWWPERHYFECSQLYDLVIPNPEKKQHT